MKTIYSSISKRVFSLLVALIMAISTVPFAAASAFAQEQGISIALALTELFIAEKQRGAAPLHRIQNRLRLHLHKTLQPALQRSYSLTAEKDMTLINFLAIRT